MDLETLIFKIKTLDNVQRIELSAFIDSQMQTSNGLERINNLASEAISSYEINNSEVEGKTKKIDLFIHQWKGFLKDKSIDSDQIKLNYLKQKHN